jgi:curved DNA-binding protein CbpA
LFLYTNSPHHFAIIMSNNHPQMSAALQNVNDLNEVYKSFRAAAARSTNDARAAEEARAKEKKEKKKMKKKEKKEKKKAKKMKKKREKKKTKKKSRRSSGESSGESSSESSSGSESSDDDSENEKRFENLDDDDDDDDGAVSQRTLLRRGQNAIEAVQHILARFPSQRQDLRALLKSVDDGNAVPIDGVPDEIMRKLLETVFRNVGMMKLPSTGAWTLTKNRLKRKEFAFAKVAMAFEVGEERLESFRVAMLPWEREEMEREEMEKRKEERLREKMERNCGREEAEVLTGEEAEARLKEHGQEIDEDSDDEDKEESGDEQHPSIKKEGTLKFKEKITDDDTVGVAIAIEGERPRKQLGPMAPPKEMLEEMQRQQRELADEGFGFGPPPPDIVEFVDSKSSESRSATARRVISILKNDGDAYDVLSASPEHSNAELKKIYWKLSLVIHPDKCDEPCAAAAFDAVKKAYEVLKDETQRKALDEKRNSAKDREEFEAWLKSEREKAIWRKKRNESLPGDEDLLDDAFDKAPGSADDDKTREVWMTELPPERKAAQGPLSASVTAFAKDGLMVRDQKTIDEWTRNPKDGKSETMLFLEQQEKMYALPNAVAQAKKEDEKRKMIDEYNEGAGRTKSLLEQHRENLGNSKKKKKKGERSSSSSEESDDDDRKSGRKKQKKKKARKDEDKKKDRKDDDEDDDGTGWTYRPFDRERDLKISKVGSMDPREAMKRAGGGLSSRFDGGGLQ